MNPKPPRDPRREGNPEPPPRPKLSSLITGQVQAIPPAVPPPVHRARPGGTMVGLPAPPARASAPMPERKPTLRDLPPETRSLTPPEMPALSTLKGLGEPPVSLPPGQRAAPPRSLSPAPVSGPAVLVDTSVGKLELRKGLFSKLAPWLVPLALSALGTIGGAILGYYEGLARAGARVAAIEEAARLNAEADARLKTRSEKELDRAFTVLDDHDRRLPRLERRVEAFEGRLPKIEGLPGNSPK